MNNSELYKTLNDKQKAYVNLDMTDSQLYNGEYMLCVFHFKPGKGLNTLQAASEIAANLHQEQILQ